MKPLCIDRWWKRDLMKVRVGEYTFVFKKGEIQHVRCGWKRLPVTEVNYSVHNYSEQLPSGLIASGYELEVKLVWKGRT